MPQEKRQFECRECGHKWESPFGGGRPGECPDCGGRDFYRCDDQRVGGRGRGRGAGAGQRRGTCRRSRVTE